MSTNAFKVEPHTFRSVRRMSWEVCTGCGLVRLKNQLTEWCVRNGCNYADHPGYRGAVATLGGKAGAT